MKRYIKEQTLYIEECLNHDNTESVVEYCNHQIAFLSNERLAHLIVTVVIAILLITFFVLSYVFDNVLFMLLVCILGILEVFYIIHYFLLENTLQKWYDYASDLDRKNLGLPYEKVYEYLIETPYTSVEEFVELGADIKRKTYLSYIFDKRISGIITENGNFSLSCKSGNASYFEFTGIVEMDENIVMKGDVIIKPFVKVFLNISSIIAFFAMLPFLSIGLWYGYLIIGIIWLIIIINYAMFLNPSSLIKIIREHNSIYRH